MILSNPIRAKATGSLFDAYRVLRVENPSPYMFYLSTSDEEIAGASLKRLSDLKMANWLLFLWQEQGEGAKMRKRI